MTDRTSSAAGLLLLSGILLAACEKSEAPPAAAPPAAARLADPELAKIFDATCRPCHVAPGNPAPQTGDRAAWASRLEQGMPTLLEHTVTGYKGMPPLGSCGDCGEAELVALIEYMALGKGAVTP